MKEIEKRKVIEAHCRAGKNAVEIASVVREIGISRSAVYKLISRLKIGKSVDRAKGSGRKLSERSRRCIKNIRQRIARNPKQSVRKIARDLEPAHSKALKITQKQLHLWGR